MANDLDKMAARNPRVNPERAQQFLRAAELVRKHSEPTEAITPPFGDKKITPGIASRRPTR
jgi:hypothetical protein